MSSPNYILYIYDLPKTVTSTTIADAIKRHADYQLDAGSKPQLNRDPNKPFFSAVVKFTLDSKEKFEELVQKLRYFEVEGKPVRGLPYDPSLLGSNRVLFNKTHTIFVPFNNKERTF